MVSLMLIVGAATGLFLLIALVARSERGRRAQDGGDGDVTWVHDSSGADFSGGADYGDSSGCGDSSGGADSGGCGDGGGGDGGGGGGE